MRGVVRWSAPTSRNRSRHLLAGSGCAQSMRANSSMPITALLLLALCSSRAGFPCALCEAGYESCGFCLNRIAHTECPASDALDIMANCTEVKVGVMCEADGECGTSTVLNNCENMNWEGVRTTAPLCCTPRRSHRGPILGARIPIPPSLRAGFTNNDVYRRVACEADVLPTCAECPAGSACGRCLKPVPFSECPGAEESAIGLDALKALKTCDLVEVGELCEADGECGTEDSTNNCVYSSRKGSLDMDIY